MGAYEGEPYVVNSRVPLGRTGPVVFYKRRGAQGEDAPGKRASVVGDSFSAG